MNIKSTLILVLLLFVLVVGNSQNIDFANYVPLESSGKMPSDICKQFSEHYQERKENLKNEKSEIKKYGSEYALTSSYYLNQILKSGKLLFGDPLSNYVNQVADNLLKKQPELKEKLKFFVIRVPYVNAFALDPGVIMVTTGLLAQIENEAQLAYVLSHEIIHIVKKHSIDLYLTEKKLNRTEDENSSTMVDSRIYKYHFRSRVHENEADQQGVEQFLSKSDYELNIIEGIFDVLQFGHLPFDELPGFTVNFETDFFHFPEHLKLKEPTLITTKDNEDDTLSTHPNIKNRRVLMNEFIKKFDGANRKLFIQPKETFLKIKDIARFETIHAQILEHDYVTAAYNIYIMLKEFPGNCFLESSMASCLYGISKYKSNGYANDIISSYKEKEGNIQQVTYFFSKISKRDLNVLALRYSWLIHKKQIENQYLTSICKDLMQELKNQKIKIEDFADNLPGDTLTTEKDTTIFENSKYGRIKETQRKKNTYSSKFVDEQAYLAYAFLDLKKDDTFIDAYENIKVLEEEDYTKKRSKSTKKGARLGIDSVIVFNPYFMKFDERKKNSIRIVTSEEKELNITKRAEEIAKKVNINAPFISSHYFSEDEVDYYNDYCSLSSWLDEFYTIDQNFTMVYYQSQFMSDITQKYNSNYLNLIGIATFIRKKDASEVFTLLLYSSTFIALPYVIYKIVTPSYTSIYMNQLININTGEVKFSSMQTFNQNSRKDCINIRLYDSFNQIKTKKK